MTTNVAIVPDDTTTRSFYTLEANGAGSVTSAAPENTGNSSSGTQCSNCTGIAADKPSVSSNGSEESNQTQPHEPPKATHPVLSVSESRLTEDHDSVLASLHSELLGIGFTLEGTKQSAAQDTDRLASSHSSEKRSYQQKWGEREGRDGRQREGRPLEHEYSPISRRTDEDVGNKKKSSIQPDASTALYASSVSGKLQNESNRSTEKDDRDFGLNAANPDRAQSDYVRRSSISTGEQIRSPSSTGLDGHFPKSSTDGSNSALHGLPRPPPHLWNVTLEPDYSTDFQGVHLPSWVMPEDTHHDNLTKVSYMLFRLIRTHSMKSLLDASCLSTMPWMPVLLHYVEFEVPGFKYTCVVGSEEDENLVRERFPASSSLDILVLSNIRTRKIPAADLAFLWNVVGFLSPGRSWQLLKALRQANVKYVVFQNFPKLKKNSSYGSAKGLINVRRPPYRFAEPLRVFHNMTINPEAVSKQMLLYDLETLKNEDE